MRLICLRRATPSAEHKNVIYINVDDIMYWDGPGHGESYIRLRGSDIFIVVHETPYEVYEKIKQVSP